MIDRTYRGLRLEKEIRELRKKTRMVKEFMRKCPFCVVAVIIFAGFFHLCFSEITRKIIEEYSNGAPKKIIYYQNNKEIAQENFNEKGDTLNLKGFIPNGIVKTYYPSGELESERNFKNNKREGIVKAYCPSGELAGEGNFKNNKQEGVFKTYYPSGKLQNELFYKNGEISHGKIYNYYDNGKPESIVEFKGLDERQKPVLNGIYQQFKYGRLELMAFFDNNTEITYNDVCGYREYGYGKFSQEYKHFPPKYPPNKYKGIPITFTMTIRGIIDLQNGLFIVVGIKGKQRNPNGLVKYAGEYGEYGATSLQMEYDDIDDSQRILIIIPPEVWDKKYGYYFDGNFGIQDFTVGSYLTCAGIFNGLTDNEQKGALLEFVTWFKKRGFTANDYIRDAPCFKLKKIISITEIYD